MYCPLKFSRELKNKEVNFDDGYFECMEDRCAWFVHGSRCAIEDIAISLDAFFHQQFDEK